MTLETIYILRHGFRMNWVTKNWESATGLPRDPSLAPFGEAQAKEVADYFLSLPEDQRPTAIFSSPYYRCLQTSKPTSTALGIPIYAEHGISEWYSPVEPGTGLHPRPASASALKAAHFSEIDDSWSSLWYPSRKGEEVEGLYDRTRGFLSIFLPEVQRRFAGTHKRILLVGHAATVIVLAQELLGERISFRAGCCSLTVLDRKVGDTVPLVGGGWTDRLLGDSSHLKDGPQREWGLEDIHFEDGKVVNDHGVPGTDNEKDEPVGSQIIELSSRT